jgi:hypothetical protein
MAKPIQTTETQIPMEASKQQTLASRLTFYHQPLLAVKTNQQALQVQALLVG